MTTGTNFVSSWGRKSHRAGRRDGISHQKDGVCWVTINRTPFFPAYCLRGHLGLFKEITMSERIYRDPVHNIIRLRTDNDEGELMMRLIDSSEFQRLRRIKQLGLGLYTYQGAEHSRFTHSLGAFHLMTRVMDRLGERYSIRAQDRVAARAAALLHDVGHGSFSHVMEKVLNFHHEQWTVQVILSDQSEIGDLLRSYSPDLPGKVASIIEGQFRPSALAQLVSSQLDVDRMDYLLRDSLMTGAKYGIYDLE